MGKKLEKYGYDSIIEYYYSLEECNGEIGRVVKTTRDIFYVQTKDDILKCVIKGNLYKDGELAIIGDWVIVENNCIMNIIKRKTEICRKTTDRRIKKQLIAANIDFVFLLVPSDNINERLLYSLLSLTSKIKTVIVFTKSDIEEPNLEYWTQKLPIYDIIVTSSINKAGIDELKSMMTDNKTGIFIGQSGVGKSTLLNTLIGKDVMKTQEINDKNKEGRHTTTHSELFYVGDFSIIDIPGMRTFTSWVDDNQPLVFEEIDSLSKGCRYRDCTHTVENGCNVLGNVDEEVLKTYHKYQDTQLYLKSKVRTEDAKKYTKKIKERINTQKSN